MGWTSNRKRRASFFRLPFPVSLILFASIGGIRGKNPDPGFNESFRRSRSSRSNSTNRPITASRSDAFDTPASYATESLTGDMTIGASDCAPHTGTKAHPFRPPMPALSSGKMSTGKA